MPKAEKTNAQRPNKRIAAQLNLEERTHLAALLNDPVMQRALGNCARCKPGVFIAAAGPDVAAHKSAELATLAANNRLHEIRGWELFEAALYRQLEDPKPRREPTAENYPESGRTDA